MRVMYPSNIWEAGTNVIEDFRSRARGERELTCCRQVAGLVAQITQPGMSLLDAACGTGHFYHSLRKAAPRVEYWGIDSSRILIDIGREELRKAGLHSSHLQVQDMAAVDATYDIVVSMNTLCFMPDYKIYLDRLLYAANHALILRMSMSDAESRSYLVDGYCDPQYQFMKLYFNTYATAEVIAFVEESGFSAGHVTDEFTKDGEEIVAGDKKLYRKILVCKRRT